MLKVNTEHINEGAKNMLEIYMKGSRMTAIANMLLHVNPLSANPIKWSNTLKQFVSKLSTNCLSVFDHFVKLALKVLRITYTKLVRIRHKTATEKLFEEWLGVFCITCKVSFYNDNVIFHVILNIK